MGKTVKPNGIRITPHFCLSEFQDKATGFVRIHPLLPVRLEKLRAAVGSPLIITSSCRIWPEHVRIYRGLYGPSWRQRISLTSQHLIAGPSKKDLEDPILAERLQSLDSPPQSLCRTCCAADIRRIPNCSPSDLGEAARRCFDFVKIYSWGIHVDLRYTPLSA